MRGRIFFDESDPVADFLGAANAISQADVQNRLRQYQQDLGVWQQGQQDRRAEARAVAADGRARATQEAMLNRQLQVQQAGIRAKQQESIYARAQRAETARRLRETLGKRNELDADTEAALQLFESDGIDAPLRQRLDPREKAKQAAAQQAAALQVKIRAARLRSLGVPPEDAELLAGDNATFADILREKQAERGNKAKAETNDKAVYDRRSVLIGMGMDEQTADAVARSGDAPVFRDAFQRQAFPRASNPAEQRLQQAEARRERESLISRVNAEIASEMRMQGIDPRLPVEEANLQKVLRIRQGVMRKYQPRLDALDQMTGDAATQPPQTPAPTPSNGGATPSIVPPEVETRIFAKARDPQEALAMRREYLSTGKVP